MMDKVPKPKVIKGMKVSYNDQIYENIISVNRGYDYNSFRYLDDKDSECSIYLRPGESFTVVE